MSFAVLALICLVALAGPVLALQRFRIPVVIGELLIGVVLGRSAFHVLDPGDPTLTFLGEIGFALVMFVAGTHVPVRDRALVRGIGVGAARAVAIGLISIPAGLGLAAAFGNDHGPLYAVLLASSSAALVIPALGGIPINGRAGFELLPQLAIADAVCIVALPLAIDPANAGRAAIGAATVLVIGAVYFLVLNWAEKTGRRRRVKDVSEDQRLALELRIVLVMLFALAAVAVALHVSVMLAGFVMGLVVAGVGESKRLARQTFALTEGLFGPIFFVWVGASLDVGTLSQHPEAIALGVALGFVAVLVHASMVFTKQPLAVAISTSAQLGVPVSAVALGTQAGTFAPGEPTALLLGALITIGAVILAAPRLQLEVSRPST